MTARVAALCLIVLSLAGEAKSQPPASQPPVRIQRVLTPAGAEAEWSGDQSRYLPIDSARFERWLARRQGSTTAEAPGARLRAAEYAAHLDEQRRLAGTTRWDVEHSSATPTILTLAPHDAQLAQAVWRRPAGDAPAVVGLTGEQRAGALVEASGTLETSWLLEPTTISAAERRFRVRLADCLQNRLSLSLPEALDVAVEHGWAEREGVPQQGVQRWKIQPDSRLDVELRIAWPERPPADTPRLLVRQRTDYRLGADGLTLETTFERVAQRWPEALIVVLPSGVRLLEATRSGTALAWERLSIDDESERIALALPTDVGGGPIQLVCRAEFSAGQSLVLPQLQLEGAQWEEGTARILAAAPLRVSRLGLSRARQTALDPDGAIRVQLFEPAAVMSLVAAATNIPTPLLRGVSLVAEGSRLTGVLLAETAGPRGETPTLEAALSPAWTIDAVEAEPRGALEAWDQQPGRFAVRLNPSTDDRRPVRLTIRGHRALEPTLQLSAGDLRMLEFQNALARRDLVSLRAAEPLRIQTRYEQDLALVAPEDLDLESARLLAEPPQGLCFAYSDSGERLRVSFTPGTPEFSAELSTTVARSGAAWSEKFRARIVPAGRPLEEVLLRLSEPRPAVAWLLGDGNSPQPLLAQRLTAAELAGRGLPEAEHVYRLSLPAAQPAAFELSGRVEHPGRSALPVALLSTIGAANQVGRVALSSTGPCEIDASLPLERTFPTPAASGPPWTTAYRYDAALPAGELRLTVSAVPDQTLPGGLWAWREETETRVAASGLRLHTITQFLENRGTAELRFQWPAELELVSAHLNGEAHVPEVDAIGPGMSLPLSPTQRFYTLRCEFRESGPALSAPQRLWAPRLRTPYHVAAHRWRLGAPARYEVWSPQDVEQVSWTTRLLGPLARTSASGGPTAWFEGGRSWLGTASDSFATEESLFESLAAASVGLASTERPTWGQWVAAWQAGLLQAGLEVLIDPNAAVRLGVNPREVAPRWSSRPTREEVERLLADAGWSVRREGTAIVLTDGGDSSQPWEEGSRSSARSLLSAMAWRTGEGYPSSPWRVSSAPHYVDPAAAPLQTIRGDWAVVARSEAWVAIFALAALGIAVITAAAARFRPRAALALGAVCLLSAATVPAGWAPLAAALPVGWMTGSALHAIYGCVRRTVGRSGTSQTLATAVAAATFLGAAAAFALPATAPVYRVLIPVDDQRQPQGSEYFVPLELLSVIEANERAAAWPAGSPLLWTGVDYRLDLSRAGAPRLHITCELRSLAPDTRFVWPGSDARWELAEVRLNGQSGRAADRAAPAVFLAEAGRHRAEFVLRAVERLQPAGPLEFDFPPQPRARVSVHGGSRAGGNPQLLEPLPANGGSAATPAPVEALGARRLRVAVQPVGDAVAAAPQRELYWMHVRPDYVTIDARLPQPEGLSAPRMLLSDQPLQVVGGNATSQAAETAASAGYRLELPAASAQGGVSGATLLAATSGVGRVSWPNLQGPGTGGRWLAVSIDPSLTWTLPPPDLTRAVPPPDFLALWGEAAARPVAVFELPAAPLEWSIETAPRPATTRGRVVAECDIALHRARVSVAAELDATTGFVLSHVVRLPPGFVLESAAVTQEGNDRLAYAARDGQDLTLFLTSPVSGPHRVRIEGSLPVADDGELTFAPVTLAGVASEPFELRLFRRVSAAAELSHVQDAVRQELPSARTEDPGRRPLASLTATSSSFEARVRVSANEPELVTAQLVRRGQTGNSATYDVDVVVQIAGGRADALRFRLPGGWPRPRIDAPGAAVEWLEGPAGETLLSLRFRTPLADAYRFRAVEWQPTTADDARLPYLASLDDERWQRFFVHQTPAVPRAPGRSALGLILAPLPPALVRLAPAQTPAWRVTSLEAAWRETGEEPAAAPVVELADYSAHRNAAGATLLTTAYDLRPAGAHEVTLQLEEGDVLLGLEVDGAPVYARQAPLGRWLLQLPSRELPQRIEAIVLQSTARDAETVAAPRLQIDGALVQIAETLWTFTNEGRDGPTASSAALDVELQRLYRTRDLLTSTVARSTGRDASGWLRTWLAQWNEAARFACARLDETSPSGSVDQAALLRRATARQQQEVMQTANERGWPPLAGLAAERPNPLRVFWATTSRPVYRSASSGDRPTLSLSGSRPWAGGFGRAAVGLVLLLGVVGLAIVVSRARRGAAGAPAWAWAAAGLFWWAFCVVPWGGLLLTAWALWQAAPRAWRVPSAAVR